MTDNFTCDNQGLRYNKGKAPLHLLPWDAILELAQIYAAGAVKYAPRNWERGMKFSDISDSLARHYIAFQKGEDFDAESGQLHSLHMAWNALALATYHLRGIGVDDRHKVQSQTDSIFNHAEWFPAPAVQDTDLMQTTAPIETLTIFVGLQFRVVPQTGPIFQITEICENDDHFGLFRAINTEKPLEPAMLFRPRSIGEIVKQ